jgi:DNA-binding transcriptional LysR family regulator
MDYRQIEAFRAVMLTRSMTVAASQLHTSQPNISRIIARLQKETGLKLFQRVGLRLVPTPEAEALFREVQRSFVGLAAIEEAAGVIRELGSGGIRIGASAALSVGVLPPAIRLFRQKRRDVAITVHTSDSASVCKWVSEGFCDFGLASFLPDMPELATELLHQENGLCIVPADHRLANKRRVQARDLDGEAFISLAPTDQTRAKIDAAFVPDGRKLNLETPHAVTICTMVSMGLGVSVVNPMVLRCVPLPNVKAIPFSPAVDFPCYSVRAAHRLDAALAAEFLDCVRQAFEPPRRHRSLTAS